MAPKKGTSKSGSKSTGAAAAKKAPKVANPLFPKREKNFRIGGDIRVSYLFHCLVLHV